MAYTLSEARNAIISYINAQWGVTSSVRWPNTPFTAPVNTAWISVDFLPGERTQGSIGSAGKNWQAGVVFVNVFFPLDAGLDVGLDLVDTMIPLLEGVKVGTHVRFEVPTIEEMIKGVGDKWNQIPVSFPWRYYNS